MRTSKNVSDLQIELWKTNEVKPVTEIFTPDEYEDGNTVLDIPVTYFRMGLIQGIEVKHYTDYYYPFQSHGYMKWAAVTGSLRRFISTGVDGWESVDYNGASLLRNNKKNFTIAIMSGNSKTGDASATPASANLRGRVTHDLVCQNTLKSCSRNSSFWILLYHYDRDKNCIRYELSAPDMIRFHGPHVQIARWKTRIVFPIIELNTANRSNRLHMA